MIDSLCTTMLFTHRRRSYSQCLTDGVNPRDMDIGLLSSIIDIPLNFQQVLLLPTGFEPTGLQPHNGRRYEDQAHERGVATGGRSVIYLHCFPLVNS